MNENTIHKVANCACCPFCIRENLPGECTALWDTFPEDYDPYIELFSGCPLRDGGTITLVFNGVINE